LVGNLTSWDPLLCDAM